MAWCLGILIQINSARSKPGFPIAHHLRRWRRMAVSRRRRRSSDVVSSNPPPKRLNSSLVEAAKVTFDLVPNKGKESAENLRV